MIVCVPIPKTASSTFHFVLENTFGISHCHTFQNRKPSFDRNDFAFAKKVFPWMQSISGGNIVNPLELGARDPFYVTILREPIARVFSHYQHMVRSGSDVPFEKAIRTNGLLQNLSVKRLSPDGSLERAKAFLETCGFVALTEKFDLSLRAMNVLNPIRLDLSYKRKQVAPDNAVKKKLEADPSAVELALEYNRLDSELYSFAIKDIFPRLCAKAGFGPSDKVETCEVFTNSVRLRYRASGVYNKVVFRQLCRVRSWMVPEKEKTPSLEPVS